MPFWDKKHKKKKREPTRTSFGSQGDAAAAPSPTKTPPRKRTHRAELADLQRGMRAMDPGGSMYASLPPRNDYRAAVSTDAATAAAAADPPDEEMTDRRTTTTTRGGAARDLRVPDALDGQEPRCY